VQARSGRAAVVTRLGKFAADAGGRIFADVIVPSDEMVIEPAAADGWFAELHLIEFCGFEPNWFELDLLDFEGPDFERLDFERLDFERLKSLAIQFGIADGSCRKRVFCERGFGDGLLGERHGDVDVLEDAARGDAEHAVGGFDEVIAFTATMLAAEVIDEAERGTELFGFDEEACAVCGPLL